MLRNKLNTAINNEHRIFVIRPNFGRATLAKLLDDSGIKSVNMPLLHEAEWCVDFQHGTINVGNTLGDGYRTIYPMENGEAMPPLFEATKPAQAENKSWSVRLAQVADVSAKLFNR